MLELNGIGKKLGNFALKDISLQVASGGYFVLLGMSGSGKTILLELIAGLRKPNAGSIFLNGIDITHVNIHERKIGIVFQDSAVFPHLSVYKNIAYSLKGKNLTKVEIDLQVKKWAEKLNIISLLDRKPQGLSGGELRRVALARTLAMEPRVMLLDEPLTSLDVVSQYDMMQLLRSINNGGQTIIHVTHDFNEAYALADTIALMQNGTIVQQGTPAELLESPQSLFMANLSGIKNFYKCKEVKAEKDFYCLIAEDGFKVMSVTTCKPGEYFYFRNGDVQIRDENIDLPNIITARVKSIFPAPAYYNIIFDSGNTIHAEIRNEEIIKKGIQNGMEFKLYIPPEAVKCVST
jgi:ABC-type Fe3+/spermidine/putrescine transport system ATPase subunit